MRRNPLPVLLTNGFCNVLAAAVAVLLATACASKDKEVDNSADISTGDPYADTRKSLGLDYDIDPDTGQMTRENSRAFSRESYFSDKKSARVSDYYSGKAKDPFQSKRFGTETAYAAGQQANERKGYSAERYQFNDRGARQQGKSARVTDNEYRDARVPVNPYRESKKRMGNTDPYHAASRAQEKDNTPSEKKMRAPSDGDPGVSMRQSDDMTVEDVRTLLNKN